MALGDQEGSPAPLVLLVPNFDVGAAIGQKVNERPAALVGRAVHCRFAIFVHGVDIGTEVEEQLGCGDGLFVGAGGFVAVAACR